MPNVGQSGKIFSNTQVGADVIKTGNIKDAEIVNADISATAGIILSKLSGVAGSGANSDITSLIGLTTPLSVAQGGTGAQTLNDHYVLIGSDTGAITPITPDTAGKVLVSNGTGADPSFQTFTPFAVKVVLATKNTADASTTQHIAHGQGKVPFFARLTAMFGTAGTYGQTDVAIALYNGSTQYSVSIYGATGSMTNDASNFQLGNTNTSRQTGVITWDATNVDITWTQNGGGSTGVFNIILETFA